ncbi:50S ribosomal protein L36 [Candidatus Gracilibacteria bacterium]|nr:50S ribosomal protein L36 [Candidatus Gracilibacteria bacterium]
MKVRPSIKKRDPRNDVIVVRWNKSHTKRYVRIVNKKNRRYNQRQG